MKIKGFLFIVAVAGLSATFVLSTSVARAGTIGTPVAGPGGNAGSLTANCTVTSSGTIFIETGTWIDAGSGSPVAATTLDFTGTGGDGTGYTPNPADTPSGAAALYLTAAVSTASTSGTLSVSASPLTDSNSDVIPLSDLVLTNTQGDGDSTGTWHSPTLDTTVGGDDILDIPASGVYHATQAYALTIPLGTPASTSYTTTINYIFASI